MKKRSFKLLLAVIGISVLAIGGIRILNWLNRPLPVSLDDPNAQPIKAIIAKSHEIEHILLCDPESEIELLEGVYRDTENYQLSESGRLLIAKYLGSEAVRQAGYLSLKKAYFLSLRSSDASPSLFVESAPDSLTQVAPTEKPIIYCPDPYVQPELYFRNIAIRDDRAVVQYKEPSSVNEAVLRQVNGQWFIISVRILIITV